jgi:iron complex transport system substrate-binding protein
MTINLDFYNSLNAFKNENVYLQMPYNFYSTNLEVALANAYFCGVIVYPDLFSDINIETKVNEISQFFLNIDINDILVEDFYGGYQKLY